MTISHFREQRIMLLARLNLGLASDDAEEINLYNNFSKKIRFKRKTPMQY